MDEAQPGQPRPDDPDGGRSSEDEAADRRAGEIPVDQRALNILGLAQARAILRAGRAATTSVDRPCPSCGSTVAHVTPADEDDELIVVCADCNHVRYEGSAAALDTTEPSTSGPTSGSARPDSAEPIDPTEPIERDELVDLDELADDAELTDRVDDEREASLRRHPAVQSRLRRRN